MKKTQSTLIRNAARGIEKNHSSLQKLIQSTDKTWILSDDELDILIDAQAHMTKAFNLLTSLEA